MSGPGAVTGLSSAATDDRRKDGRERRVTTPWLVLLTAVTVVAAVAIAWSIAWGTITRLPGDRSVEAGFARDMAIHHLQAVDLAMLVQDLTEDPMIKGLAVDIALTQQHQVGQMFGWLDVWELAPAGSEPPMAWMDHHLAEGERMPGLASRAEITSLKGMTGVAADREFLRLMIAHHEGGVPMAEAAVERSDEAVVQDLARGIVASQLVEMETMRRLLAERGGAA